MPFLGVSPTQEFTSVAKQTITGDGSTSYTLNKGVSTENDLAVFVNDVRQEPGVAYTASANTITFTANLESTDSCYILHIGRAFSSAESPGIDDNATSKVVTIQSDGHIVPTANVTYDLGTSDLRFRDLYLSGSSLHLGAHEMTANATHVSMGNVATTGVMSGNAALMTSLNADELTSGTLPLARLPDDVTIVNDLTIGGDFVVNGNTTTIAANELKVEDSLIQLATNNEISDTIDIGFVGHYSNDGGTTALHTGFFRDASDERYYLFNGYEDAAFDTATPPSTIDRTANTFSLADLVVNKLGVGTTPSGADLHLDSNDSNVTFRLENSTNDNGYIQYTSAGKMRFYTGAAGGATASHVIIDNAGQVGIGTDNPATQLHLVDTTPILRLQSNGAATNNTISFLSRNISNVAAYADIIAEGVVHNSTNAPIVFTQGSGQTERMRIHTNGFIGIDEAAPIAKLHITSGDSGGVIPSTSYDELMIEGSDRAGITIATSNSGYGSLVFGDTEHSTAGYIYYNHSIEKLYLGTDATPALIIDGEGDVGIGTTNPERKLFVYSSGTRSDVQVSYGAVGTTASDGAQFGIQAAGAYIWNFEPTDLYFATNNVRAMTINSDSQLLINRTSSISAGTASKLCITGNIDIDGNPGSTNVIRLHQSGSEMGQIYGHTTGLRFYNFSGDATSIKAQGAATLKLIPGGGAYNSILQLLGNTDQIDVEGFEIWYDNDVGDVHLNTTYNHPNAAIRFHTRVGASQSESNERFTITGDGLIGINTNAPSYLFHVNGSSSTAQTFYVNSGNYNGTQTLFEHTGASTPVPYAIAKSGYTGNSTGYGLLHLHMNHNTTGGGSNLYFTLLDSNSNLTEYAGLGAEIVDNTHGSEDGRLNFWTMHNGSGRSLKMYLDSNGSLNLTGSTAGTYILNADTTAFAGRMAAMPGRFIIGPNGNSYPDIGYNFNQTTTGTSQTRIAGDTSYKINFGTGGKFTFSAAGSAAQGTTITWTDVMTITNGAFVGIGSNATSPITPLHVHAQQSNYGPIAARTGNYTTIWSILPWSSNNTYISSGVYYSNGSWVHAGPTGTNCLFDIGGNGGIRWYASNNSSGSWNVASNVQLFNSSGQLTASSASDSRLKENVADYSIATALQKVNALRPVSFEWNETIKAKKGAEYEDGTHVGFIAQEVETVYPEACLISDIDEYDEDLPFDMDPDATYYGEIRGVRAEKMVPILVGAIKELTRRLELLENA